MATMKRIRPTRSFSSAIGGPGAEKRQKAIVFGRKPSTTAGPMEARTKLATRTAVRFDLPTAKADAMRKEAKPNVRIEADDSLELGTMRVTYDDGTVEVVPSPKG